MPRKRTGYDAACYYDGKLLGRCTKADSDAYSLRLMILLIITVRRLENRDIIIAIGIGRKRTNLSRLLVASATALVKVEELTAITGQSLINPEVTAVVSLVSHFIHSLN